MIFKHFKTFRNLFKLTLKYKAVMSKEELQREELKAHNIERRLPFTQAPLGRGEVNNHVHLKEIRRREKPFLELKGYVT